MTRSSHAHKVHTIKVGIPGHVAHLDAVAAAHRQARWRSEYLHTQVAKDCRCDNRHKADRRGQCHDCNEALCYINQL